MIMRFSSDLFTTINNVITNSFCINLTTYMIKDE